MKSVLIIGTVFCLSIASNDIIAQQVIPLYDGKIPNSKETPDKEYETAAHFLGKVSRPILTVFQPKIVSATRTAVIVCPGGGYSMLNFVTEGSKVAQQLNSLGITAFVLKYRLPDDSTMIDKSIGPLQDAQQAVVIIRKRAKEWNIDTAKIGIIGFSAGGHLAITLGTHFNKSFVENPSQISLRPDFMILVYPVVSFTDSLAQKNSRSALIGKAPGAEQITFFSGELQVNAYAPPTFILHAGDDGVVSVGNSIALYLALQKNKVPAGLHIFPTGQHGFLKQPANSAWFSYCVQWMRENKFL
jgi:acetyl esterase/lipase